MEKRASAFEPGECLMKRTPFQALEGTGQRWEFEATREEVSRICESVRAFLEGRADEAWISEFDLGLTEALTNVVRHAYAGTPGGRVELTLKPGGSAIELAIRDRGMPAPEGLFVLDRSGVFNFDPANIQSLPEGGMGLALIRRCFNKIEYSSVNAENTLELIKCLPGK
jgi:serine/threonine-protein kinase RsbW